jgi:hypothetical protein
MHWLLVLFLVAASVFGLWAFYSWQDDLYGRRRVHSPEPTPEEYLGMPPDKFSELFFPTVVVTPDEIGYSVSRRFMDYSNRIRGRGVKRVRSRDYKTRPRPLTRVRGFTKALR